ncbi:MAG: hypothetical protein ACRDT0_27560 [Pseudonocardiaceae bacterium]
MTEQPSAQSIQNPLTLVMKAKSPEDHAALRQTVEHIQSLPPEQNPIVTALDRIATVHFATFVFLDDDRLAVITTYDGDFEKYINEFTNEIGDVFNTLLAHVADAPPLPVQTYRREFLEFVRAHDLRCVAPLYSAYPDRTVLDIVDMASVSS